ncbi:MAG: polysaccharide biosynthesis/export family protein, partial [Arenibacterium sp.]
MSRIWKTGATALALLMAAGCTKLGAPQNLESIDLGEAYQAQYREMPDNPPEPLFLRSTAMNAQKCATPLDGTGKGFGRVESGLAGARLTRNDLISLRVEEDETFSGDYVISRDGTIELPFLSPIRAQGRLVREVEADIAAQLVSRDFFVERPRVSVRVADFASVSVGVSGAVFEPRAVEIGGIPGDQIDSRRQSALGASTEARNLSAALRAAGGVRPDADISAVQVRRGARLYTLDMRGVFEGHNAVD